MSLIAASWSDGYSTLPVDCQEGLVRGHRGIWAGFESLFYWPKKDLPRYRIFLGARDRYKIFDGSLSLTGGPIHTPTILERGLGEGWRWIRCGREKNFSVVRVQVSGEIFCAVGICALGTTWSEAVERIKTLVTGD